MDNPYLLRRHFGREIIATRLELALDDPTVTELWLQLYSVDLSNIVS
jgi:hypothetical protein